MVDPYSGFAILAALNANGPLDIDELIAKLIGSKGRMASAAKHRLLNMLDSLTQTGWIVSTRPGHYAAPAPGMHEARAVMQLCERIDKLTAALEKKPCEICGG